MLDPWRPEGSTSKPEQKNCTCQQGRVPGASEQEEYKMCYKVECDKCGKFTWKGCGQHVKSVYDGIEKGKHCACKEWPGVDTKVEEGSTSTTKEGEAKA